MNKKIFSIFAFLLVASMAFVMAAPGNGSGQGSENFEVGQRTMAQTGEHMNEFGQMMRIQAQSINQFKIESGGVSADCDLVSG